MQSAGPQVNPTLLAGGIWEALLTTAVGLAIAIPAMAAYHYLEGRVDQIRSDMQDAVAQVLVSVRNPESSGPATILEMKEG